MVVIAATFGRITPPSSLPQANGTGADLDRTGVADQPSGVTDEGN